MSSILIAVADGIAADLNGHTFSPAFQAARSYADETIELAAAPGTLFCDVVPASEIKTELEDRGSVRYLATAYIVLRKKFAAGDIERVGTPEVARVKHTAVDPLVGLVESVNEFLTGLPRLASFPDAVWDATAIEAAVVRKHLREWHQFTGIIKATYEVPKALA